MNKMMKKIKVTIDNIEMMVDEDSTILQAAKSGGIYIPTLCHREDLITKGNCRVCSVEVDGHPKLVTACTAMVREGMRIVTQSERVLETRKGIIELILTNHHRSCPFCARNKSCELQKVADDSGITYNTFEEIYDEVPADYSNGFIMREVDKCIRCSRCVDVCREQTVEAVGKVGRGADLRIEFIHKDNQSMCVQCGKCLEVCPVASIYPANHIFGTWPEIDNPEKYVVVYMPSNMSVEGLKLSGLKKLININNGQIVSFLRKSGFDQVLNSNMAADLKNERIVDLLAGSDKKRPLLNTNNVSAIHFIEKFYPTYKDHLLTTETALQLMGKQIKSYYAGKLGINEKDIVTVAISNDLSVKAETLRLENMTQGTKNIDYVLSGIEIGMMMKQSMMNIGTLDQASFDHMEDMESQPSDALGLTLNKLSARKSQSVSDLGTLRKLLEKIENGESDLDYIDIVL